MQTHVAQSAARSASAPFTRDERMTLAMSQNGNGTSTVQIPAGPQTDPANNASPVPGSANQAASVKVERTTQVIVRIGEADGKPVTKPVDVVTKLVKAASTPTITSLVTEWVEELAVKGRSLTLDVPIKRTDSNGTVTTNVTSCKVEANGQGDNRGQITLDVGCDGSDVRILNAATLKSLLLIAAGHKIEQAEKDAKRAQGNLSLLTGILAGTVDLDAEAAKLRAAAKDGLAF